MAVSVKNNRIDLRVDINHKKVLETAAELNHLSLSAYIISVCLKQAKMDIQENETLFLSQSDRILVNELLTNPPEPDDALKELLK